MNKYKLTDETLSIHGHTLYRIIALVSIPKYGVKKGDNGGFVQGEKNLSQNGDAWVSGNAYVYGNAYVSGNAHVSGNGYITGTSKIITDLILKDWRSYNINQVKYNTKLGKIFYERQT